MATVTLSQMPGMLQMAVIASSDTNPISVVAAAAGQRVRVWGLMLAGGTSILIKSDNTALTGVITTTGLALPTPKGNKADSAYPHFESAVGETIKITPGASGLNGVVYYTQD